jgi:hypothetical protein
MKRKGRGLCPAFNYNLALGLQVCKFTEDIIQFRGHVVLRYEITTCVQVKKLTTLLTNHKDI